MECVKPDGERCQTTYFWTMCQFWFYLSVSCDLFVFVELFLRLSFIQILDLVVLSFHHFEGSFHFWEHLWGLVLRPFSTWSSLLSFTPFSCFLRLPSLLVASFFCSLFSRASLGSVLCVRLFRFCFCFAALSFTGSVLSSLQTLDPFTF